MNGSAPVPGARPDAEAPGAEASTASDDTQRLAPQRRGVVVGVALVLLAAHVGLTLVACPPAVVFSERPYGVGDYYTHYQQARTVGQALSRYGRSWAYDPNLLAGVPAGLFFDVDNKAHTLWTYALSRAGVHPAVAFNLFTPLSCLLAPLSLLLAASLLRLGRRAGLWAMALGIALWHFDSALRYFWSSGMISFSTVSYGALVALALCYRLMERPRLRIALALSAVLGLLLLVHVWTFAICVVPMLGLYLARLRRLRLAGHLQVWGVAVAAVAINLFWLLPALRHLELMAPAAVLGQANPIYLLADYLGVVRLPLRTDFIFIHTFFRFAALFAALCTLWLWRRERDPRLLLGGLTLLWLHLAAYLGGWIPGLRATEPYRFVAPAMLVAALLAGPALARLRALRPLNRWGAAQRVVLALLLLLLAPRALREVLYYLPEASPPAYMGAGDPAAAGLAGKQPVPAAVRPFRLRSLPDEVVQLARYLDRHCQRPGRVLVPEWTVAEALRWLSERPVMGGFAERRTIHEAAHLFRRHDDPRQKGAAYAAYLERYAISYLVLRGGPRPGLELRPGLLRLKTIVAGFRVHEVLRPASLVARGRGKVVEASLNRIVLQGAQASPRGDLVLRYHHMDTLRCEPGCRVEREPVPGDPAGFIRLVGQGGLSSQLTVENAY